MKFRAYGYDVNGKVVLKSVVYEDVKKAEFWAKKFERLDFVSRGVAKEVKR